MKSLDFSRSDRLSDQVRSEISIILRDKVKDPRLSGLTVLKVEITKDIQKAYIYFSSSNSFNNTEREDVLLGLNKAKGFDLFCKSLFNFRRRSPFLSVSFGYALQN